MQNSYIFMSEDSQIDEETYKILAKYQDNFTVELRTNPKCKEWKVYEEDMKKVTISLEEYMRLPGKYYINYTLPKESIQILIDNEII